MNQQKPAKGLKGFLLFDPDEKKYYFRVYAKESNTLPKYLDYKLDVYDMEIEIIDDYVFIDPNENSITYRARKLILSE